MNQTENESVESASLFRLRVRKNLFYLFLCLTVTLLVWASPCGVPDLSAGWSTTGSTPHIAADLPHGDMHMLLARGGGGKGQGQGRGSGSGQCDGSGSDQGQGKGKGYGAKDGTGTGERPRDGSGFGAGSGRGTGDCSGNGTGGGSGSGNR